MLLFILVRPRRSLPGSSLERAGNWKDREGLREALQAFLDRRAVDDDNVTRIDFRILGLAMADRPEIERGRLALSADAPEYRDTVGVGVLGRSTGERDRLHQARGAAERE